MIVVRRAVVAPVVVLAALGLAACGNGSSGHTATTAASRPTASVSVAPSPSVSVAPGNFTGEAVTVFGQDKVQAGYKEMAEFTAEKTFSPDLMRTKTHTAADFAGPRGQMSDRLRSDWDSIATKAAAGDKEAQSSVRLISYYNLDGDGYELAKSGPLVVNQTVTAPTVSVDRNSAGVQRLVLTLTQHGEVRLTKSGSPVRYGFDKTVTYRLVPAPAGSAHGWLIDGVRGTYKSGTETPDTAQ